MKHILIFIISLLFTATCGAKEHKFEQLSLSEFNEESIMKLSVIYGYARYFYPNPHIEKMDWHFYLEKKINKILTLTNEQDVDSFLLKEFSVFIPQLAFSSIELPLKTSLTTNSFFVKENNVNTGFSKTPIMSAIKMFKDTDTNIPVPDEYYSFPLYGALHAYFPLALYDLPAETNELKQVISGHKGKLKKGFYASPYFRIANAIINNNIIQHFYAYYKEDGLDSIWSKNFKTYIGQVANCTSYKEYLEYTYTQYSHMKDNHVYIFAWNHRPGTLLARYIRIYYPNIVVRYIEGKIYIVDYADTYKEMRIGDEIISVNGVPIEALIEQKSKFVSASTDASLYYRLCENFLFQSFTKDSVFNLGIKRGDFVIEEIPVIANKKTSRTQTVQNKFITEIEDGIWLINLYANDNVNYKTFVQYIDQFQKAKGLIIDIRRGSDYTTIMSILSHFIDNMATIGQILTPTYYYPNHINVKYEITESSKWGVYPSTDNYKKEYVYEKPFPVRINTPVTFLTGPRVFSFGETIMELVKHFKIGTIIGEHTAGTNGDMVLVKSPAAGYMFTGYKFIDHDGKKHHGIGTSPDIECHMKIEDIRKGVDTQIKKACEIINESLMER